MAGAGRRRVAEWMKSNNVTRLIVMQYRNTLPRDEKEAQQIVENFKAYSGQIYRFCVLLPKDVPSKEAAVKALRKIKAEGVIGFGEHYGRTLDFDDPKCMQLYAACAEVGLPVLFHMDHANNVDDAGHVFANAVIGMLVDQAQSETRHRGASVRVVKKALRAIEASVGKPFHAAMLAKQIGVSQEHLNRVFRMELGQTPYQCICEAKMRRACELLKNTDQKVANIAAQLGYGPDSHFARLFKRVIGVTPGRFRSGVSMPIRPPSIP